MQSMARTVGQQPTQYPTDTNLCRTLLGILMSLKDYKLFILFFLLSLSSREKSQSLLPVWLFVLPPFVLFADCSLRQSRSSAWLFLSLSFLFLQSWLHLAFLTILILIVCSLVTLWCTWLWCGLRDGGNYHRVGGGMPLSLHLLHGDKPQQGCSRGTQTCTASPHSGYLHPQSPIAVNYVSEVCSI